MAGKALSLGRVLAILAVAFFLQAAYTAVKAYFTGAMGTILGFRKRRHIRNANIPLSCVSTPKDRNLEPNPRTCPRPRRPTRRVPERVASAEFPFSLAPAALTLFFLFSSVCLSAGSRQLLLQRGALFDESDRGAERVCVCRV